MFKNIQKKSLFSYQNKTLVKFIGTLKNFESYSYNKEYLEFYSDKFGGGRCGRYPKTR